MGHASVLVKMTVKTSLTIYISLIGRNTLSDMVSYIGPNMVPKINIRNMN